MTHDNENIKEIISRIVGNNIIGTELSQLIEKAISNTANFIAESYDTSTTDTSTIVGEEIESQNENYPNNSSNNIESLQIFENIMDKNINSNISIENIYEKFKEKNNGTETEYIYLDFTQNLKSGSRNWSDIYQESLEEQFKKIQHKLIMYNKSSNLDFNKFITICFPLIKSKYYISLPSFNRKIEVTKQYQGSECIYNMVLRPIKNHLILSIIPKELDIILIGDLVFRNNLVTFVVKGIDLIDENVEKFGELLVECATACALTKNSKNLPDYGIENRELYKSFLTRDMILTLCEHIYPIEAPEKAINVFIQWKQYIEFRRYFLNVQSQRNESIDDIKFIRAYSIGRNIYNKNEEIYAQYLLDNNKNFIQREQVFLNTSNEDTIEFPIIRIEIIKNLAEISRNLTRDKKISIFERELRRFTRVQVALSQKNPRTNDLFENGNKLIYLGDRIAFEAKDVEPNYDDIISFFEKKLNDIKNQIDEKYQAIIKSAITSYAETKKAQLELECNKDIEEYNNLLDDGLEYNFQNNTNNELEKKFLAEKNKIKIKYANKIKALQKNSKDKKELEKIINDLEFKEIEEIEAIPRFSWYKQENEKLKEEFKNQKIKQKENELKKLCSEKEKSLKYELEKNINAEKKVLEEKISNDKSKEILAKKTKLTERHFYIYFKAEDIEPDYFNQESLSKYNYLVYDNRAENAKIERQKKTLEAFYQGYVKNPFLASYLFVPETLGKSENEIVNEIEWFGNRLNSSQKEAVKKALSSNSIFLLQGPPGTGKTEVIAEITAQYIKQGKKVLISSETHKAIDNVFDRLPKIPEIRPLRLIPSQSNKDSEYSPEKLVDNLYQNISSRLDKRIQKYDNFNEMKNSFNEKMKTLKYKYNQLLRTQDEYENIQIKKKSLQNKNEDINTLIQEQRNNKIPFEEEILNYDQLILCIKNGDFSKEIEKNETLLEIGNKVYDYLTKYDFFDELNFEKIKDICQIELSQINDEFKIIEKNTSSMGVERKKAEIKAKIQAIRDPDTDDILEGKEKEYEELRRQLIQLKNEKDEENSINYSSLAIAKFIPANKLTSSIERTKFLQYFADIKKEITALINIEIEKLSNILTSLQNNLTTLNSKILELKNKKNLIQDKIEELNNDTSYLTYQCKQQELRKEIVDFFTDFEILEEYPTDNYYEAIEIIIKKWNDIEKNQVILEQENKTKIPMYKAINNYLANEEILEEDRINYTQKLFNNANVFGMTCTSRERFSESSMKALREYKLGDINIRNVGIDVVIIDEVSKSSFLDLMIPILYGKTIILVGDHRQLPPLYDLKHMKKNDFDGLNPEIIDYDLNKEYQKLYETCFFKKLFETVPNEYKIMLDKQYRCHSDIMDVFNHFYTTNGKGLSIGLSNQNDLKNHYLSIKNRGVTLFEPNNHIYFVNCTEFESHLDLESSSIVNRQEAEVICQLLKLMNEEYGQMIENGLIKKDKRRDERKSIGVICTYRDQARLIKNNLKGLKFNNFSQKREDRLIINTVDDFQGDERDIIIVSMVRNPRGNRYSTDFIDQFERINVALSRARCMLVIVGSQEFLSRSSINLPDINGNKNLDKKSFPVYKEIIRTIQAKGKILQASDIIEEVKNVRK